MSVSNIVDPLLCPLCGNSNACVNLGSDDVTKSCWCNDPNIQFPPALLEQVPAHAKRKACICRRCAEKFQLMSNPDKANKENITDTADSSVHAATGSAEVGYYQPDN